MSAFWITPNGTLIEVDNNHINTIIAYPRKFGLTRAAIETAYRKRGEPMGAEGYAREDIMIKLMNKGWIRIRYVPRQDFYTVQLSDVHYKNESWAKPVTDWARWMVKQRGVSEMSAVVVLDLGGQGIYPEKQLYELAAGALFETRKRGTFAAYLNPKKKRSSRK